MEPAMVREALRRLIRERSDSYAALSRLLGRNETYVQQFVTRGSPTRLEENDRRTLARYFDVDESVLGGPASSGRSADIARVPKLSVEASAGPGRLVDAELAIGTYGFDRGWLRQVCRARPEDLSIIRVTGDSMAPTLIDGDDVLVDQSDGAARLRDGIYVLRRDDMLIVKRLALAPNGMTVTIASDNPAYPGWPDCPIETLSVVGRVVWTGRKLG